MKCIHNNGKENVEVLLDLKEARYLGPWTFNIGALAKINCHLKLTFF
jgi:hypothetical protein